MRLMLDNFHSFTVSLLYHLFKKKIDICLQLTVTALNQKGKKKVRKGTDYRERERERESWAEKRKKKKKKKKKEERRRRKKEEGRRRRRKRVLGGLDWTAGGGCR